jgi:dissimilatory sulfite reductase (desulfoviridin) alpha/beta subunit
MARPKKKERLTQTTFRLSEAELRAIQEAADSWGVTPSHFIRAAGSAVASSTPEEQADILRSVNRQSGGAAIPTAED